LPILEDPAFALFVAAVVRRLISRFDKLKASRFDRLKTSGVTTAATVRPGQSSGHRTRREWNDDESERDELMRRSP
jgi:hypothetical protein